VGGFAQLIPCGAAAFLADLAVRAACGDLSLPWLPVMVARASTGTAATAAAAGIDQA
jgi:hypothetical protein